MALQQDTIQNTVQNVIQDTIVAIATANGLAGVGIVRLSGPQALSIGCALTTKTLVPRHAAYVQFLDAAGESIDDGIAVYFAAPHSYTGEDVVELQAHGNPIVLACLLRRCLALGARLARPGEFTERAFLNEKLDLAQAEAVADLISAGSEAAVRAARRSLDGVFSRRIDAIAEQLTDLRVYVEAALDFPDEEIDFLAAPELRERLKAVTDALAVLRKDAEHGKRLMDGVHAVIVGVPNVGKSSLLNALAGEDRAIVTDIAGTTRDILRETLTLDGVTLTLVDTAGLRDAVDSVEAEGIRRARAEVSRADLVLAVVDDDEPDSCLALADELQSAPKILWLHNKCDLQGGAARVEIQSGSYHFWLSAKTGVGLDILRAHLATGMGGVEGSEGGFSARARHLEALASTQVHLDRAASHLQDAQGELAAEDLRQSQEALGEITGRMDADALLGRIFSSFCIGK